MSIGYQHGDLTDGILTGCNGIIYIYICICIYIYIKSEP